MSSESKGDDVQVPVPHVQQKHSWDCGLACVQMVLLYFAKSFDSSFSDVCSKLNFGQSVWTIDVASILHFYGISFHYTTITLGVDKGYSNKSFYKNKFTADEQRVTDLFNSAQTEGISIEQRSVPLEELVSHLQSQGLVICLVDWNHLFCNWCDIKCLVSLSCVGRCLNSFQGTGHYIVLCGVNIKEKLIYYKNPSYSKELETGHRQFIFANKVIDKRNLLCGELCCCSWTTLERARKSYGTDEDLVFIDKTSRTVAEETVTETEAQTKLSSGRI